VVNSLSFTSQTPRNLSPCFGICNNGLKPFQEVKIARGHPAPKRLSSQGKASGSQILDQRTCFPHEYQPLPLPSTGCNVLVVSVSMMMDCYCLGGCFLEGGGGRREGISPQTTFLLSKRPLAEDPSHLMKERPGPGAFGAGEFRGFFPGGEGFRQKSTFTSPLQKRTSHPCSNHRPLGFRIIGVFFLENTCML